MAKSKTKVHEEVAICGAKTRAGTPCKKTAGWGTNHVGTGRCRLHGGASTGPKDRKAQSEKLKKNDNAMKHGLFAKHIPKETLEIVDEIEDVDHLDVLWNNIKIQYAAIIRAQDIMFVEDKNDNDKFIVEEFQSELGDKYKYQIASANEKQANFLQSQSRAMTTLARMIKDYEELCKAELNHEEQKLRIEKLKQGLGTETNGPIEIRLVDKDE